jgi:hypothetical protein
VGETVVFESKQGFKPKTMFPTEDSSIPQDYKMDYIATTLNVGLNPLMKSVTPIEGT